MSEMIERVAMGIAQEIGWGTFSHFDPTDVRRISRAALEALKPSTEAMRRAGGLAINADEDVLVVTAHEAGQAWSAMIDEALT